jgi:bla regulator protein blaR1
MTPSSTVGSNFGKTALLAVFGIAAAVGPVLFILVNGPRISAQSTQTTEAPSPSFEVASIKLNHSGDRRGGLGLPPGRFMATNTKTKLLIAFAYHVQDFQVSEGPSWVDSERYDIDGKEEDSLAATAEKLAPDQRADQVRLMLRSLLVERFKLKVSHATKELPVYALVVAKNGPKLHEQKPGDNYSNGIQAANGLSMGPHTLGMRPGQLTGQGISMAELTMILSQQLGRIVVDQSGLKGNYDFTLQWTPDQTSSATVQAPEGGKPAVDNALPPESSGPSIFTALQEQLGLKLESTKGPVDVLVIEHIERPSEN